MIALTLYSVFLSALPVAAASGPTATEIVRYGEEVLRGRSTQAAMVMIIRKPDFTRRLTLRSWTSGPQQALVEILAPAKEAGISSLRVEGQMWNYLPRTDQVIRVPTSLMLQSWMGSDFTNDDLMRTSSLGRDYAHKTVRVDGKGRNRVTLIQCRPKPGAPVVWGKVLYWARTRDRLPVRQAYYDERGKWVRTIEYSKFRKMDDRVVPTVITVRVAENSRQSTTITYRKLLYDRAIDDAVFSQDLLRRNAQNGKFLGEGWSVQPIAGTLHLATRRR